MGRIRDALHAEPVAVLIGVVGQHVDGDRRVLRGGRRIVGGYRRMVGRRGHGHGDVRRRRVAGRVADRVGERVGAGKVGVRRVGGGGAVGRGRAVGRLRDAIHGQRVAVRVGVVGQHADGDRSVLGRPRRIIVGDGRAIAHARHQGVGELHVVDPPALTRRRAEGERVGRQPPAHAYPFAEPGEGTQIHVHLGHRRERGIDRTAGPGRAPGNRAAEVGADRVVVPSGDERAAAGHHIHPGAAAVGAHLQHAAVERVFEIEAMPEDEVAGGGNVLRGRHQPVVLQVERGRVAEERMTGAMRVQVRDDLPGGTGRPEVVLEGVHTPAGLGAGLERVAEAAGRHERTERVHLDAHRRRRAEVLAVLDRVGEAVAAREAHGRPVRHRAVAVVGGRAVGGLVDVRHREGRRAAVGVVGEHVDDHRGVLHGAGRIVASRRRLAGAVLAAHDGVGPGARQAVGHVVRSAREGARFHPDAHQEHVEGLAGREIPEGAPADHDPDRAVGAEAAGRVGGRAGVQDGVRVIRSGGHREEHLPRGVGVHPHGIIGRPIGPQENRPGGIRRRVRQAGHLEGEQDLSGAERTGLGNRQFDHVVFGAPAGGITHGVSQDRLARRHAGVFGGGSARAARLDLGAGLPLARRVDGRHLVDGRLIRIEGGVVVAVHAGPDAGQKRKRGARRAAVDLVAGDREAMIVGR